MLGLQFQSCYGFSWKGLVWTAKRGKKPYQKKPPNISGKHGCFWKWNLSLGMSDMQQWCSAKTNELTSTMHNKGQNISVLPKKLCQSLLHLSSPKIFHLGNPVSSSKWLFVSSWTSALLRAVLMPLTMCSLTHFPLQITYQPKLKPKHCRKGEGETEQSAPVSHHGVLDTASLCHICWVQPPVTHYKVLVC